MPEKFQYSGLATISHLNTRKEGDENAKELALDLKLSATIDDETIRQFDEFLPAFLYTDIGAVRNVMLGPIPVKSELEGYRMTLIDRQFYGVKVKKFSIEAMDGRKATLVFSISFKPNGNEVAQIAEFLQDDIEIVLEPANEELDLDGCQPDKMAEFNDRLSALAPAEAYKAAKEVVAKAGRVSISLVQRELRIGYNLAASLIERMEAEGFVSTMNGRGERVVLGG